jgi:hypothetical protein
MPFSTYDEHDAVWENPNTGRTVYRPGRDALESDGRWIANIDTLAEAKAEGKRRAGEAV